MFVIDFQKDVTDRLLLLNYNQSKNFFSKSFLAIFRNVSSAACPVCLTICEK